MARGRKSTLTSAEKAKRKRQARARFEKNGSKPMRDADKVAKAKAVAKKKAAAKKKAKKKTVKKK